MRLVSHIKHIRENRHGPLFSKGGQRKERMPKWDGRTMPVAVYSVVKSSLSTDLVPMRWRGTIRDIEQGDKLKEGKVRWNIRKKVIAKMVVRHWQRLPREIGMLHSWRHSVPGFGCCFGRSCPQQEAWYLMNFKFLPTQIFYVSMILQWISMIL